ncbi:MAG: hypothetical protein JSV46_08360 [Candidatus Aminicenantes bacterium]|nr:MAG: hypothetical protein JSV46_08360 [Candidatus Aminicenantes bacterium]
MEKEKVSAILGIMVFFLTSSLLWGFPELSKEKLEKTEEMRREIRLLNLINGLDLTPKQMEIVLENAEEYQSMRAQFEKVLLNRQDEMETVLEEIRGYLRENKEIPSQVAQQYHRLNREIREARLKIQEEMKDFAKEIEESLEPHQLYQLQEFVPCIIPPKGEMRIGQAKDYKGLTRSLERIRRIPSRLYQQRRDEIMGRTLEGLKLHAPFFSDLNEEEMKRHVELIYDEARNLEDVEFEIQKEQLAEDLISPFKPEVPENNLMRKIAGFLLSEEVIPVLEARIDRGDSSRR